MNRDEEDEEGARKHGKGGVKGRSNIVEKVGVVRKRISHLLCNRKEI